MKPNPKYPCPLCQQAMSAQLEVWTGLSLYHYAKVAVKFICVNNDCRYEERTRGESTSEETIAKLQDLVASFRGPEMFKHGQFKQGSVRVNRRRHLGPNSFIAVDPPKE